MMFWIQEQTNKHPDADLVYLMQELDADMHEYIQISKSSVNTLDISSDPRYYQSIVPVGDLHFVQTVLSKIHRVDHMYPIEVPEVLRTPEFLNRKYSIRKYSDLPKEGYYFIKGVSRLKDFSYDGQIEYIHEGPKNDFTVHFKESDLYQVSESVNIISEFRVFVHNDEIIGIHYYDGDCKAFPNIAAIRDMVRKYKQDNLRPKAYTMDVAVVYARGTSLIEVHPWVSVGLYGYMFESHLPYCYRDGFEYYTTINKPISEWRS